MAHCLLYTYSLIRALEEYSSARLRGITTMSLVSPLHLSSHYLTFWSTKIPIFWSRVEETSLRGRHDLQSDMLLAFLSDNILCHSSECDEGFAAFPRAFRLKQPCLLFYFILLRHWHYLGSRSNRIGASRRASTPFSYLMRF